MTEDDYKHEIAARRLEVATLLALLAQGRVLMNQLAEACDGAVLAGEPYPPELNERVRNWCHANWAQPIAETLKPKERYLDCVMVKIAGVPVIVSGIGNAYSAQDWQRIDEASKHTDAEAANA